MYNKNLPFILPLYLLFTLVQPLCAQDISLESKIKSNAVHLKILPRDASTWLKGVEQGYLIERRILGEEENFIAMNSSPLKPKSENNLSPSPEVEERYEFHKNAVEKMKGFKISGSFYETFKQMNRSSQNYRMYLFVTMRDSLLSDVSGLEFVDNNVSPDKIYQYRVKIAGSNIISSYEIVDGMRTARSPFLRYQSKEKSVKLNWGHEENGSILGYYVERSETGLVYDRINESPILNSGSTEIDTIDINRSIELSFTDSLEGNYKSYYYQLVALDIWGDELPPSQPIVAMGIDLTPPEISSDFTVSVDTITSSFNISWSPSKDSDVQSYFITLAEQLGGQDSAVAQGILPSSSLSYNFPNPIEMKNHYFKIGVIDTSGNYAMSEPKVAYLPDHTAPTRVVNVDAVVDTNGVVTLSWTPSKDANLNGYLVFRSFLKDSDFIKITDTVYENTTYNDSCTLHLLNNNRFYYVTALDKSFNTSPQSDVVQIILPDTVAPSRTLISEINEQSDSIEIRWKKNQSSDIMEYRVYKDRGGKWIHIGTTHADSHSIMDVSSSEDQVGYKVFAVDESGNIGRNSFAKYKSLSGDKAEQKLDLRVEKNDSKIILSWNEVGSKYKIYQEKADGYILKDYVDKAMYEKNETSLSKGKYYVKAYDERGRFITKSKIIQL